MTQEDQIRISNTIVHCDENGLSEPWRMFQSGMKAENAHLSEQLQSLQKEIDKAWGQADRHLNKSRELREQLQSQAKEIEELLKEIESHKEIEEIYSNADLTRGETSILGPNKEPLFHAEAKVFAALFDELDKADSIQRNKQ